MANLMNSGILPLVFVNEADYDGIDQGDVLKIVDVRANVDGKDVFCVENETKGKNFEVRLEASERLRKILLEGGLLNYTKKNAQ